MTTVTYCRLVTLTDNDQLTITATERSPTGGYTSRHRKWILMTSAAKMPSSCKFGRYRNVAVVEIAPSGPLPCRIDDRLRSVVAIPLYRGRLNVGRTEAGAYQRAMAEARDLLRRMAAGEVAV